MKQEKKEAVNHPSHYNDYDVEVIEMMRRIWGDEIELLKESHPIARKEHRCMFCGCIIPKGERYRRTTNKYDGDIYEFVTHEP